MSIRLADYVVQKLADSGLRDIFLVTGGGAMHLNDAIGKESRIRYVCNHHEQAAAMAAEGYARVSGGMGVVNVTAGPGAINALNGVFGAFTDSIPMLVLSGQVKRETLLPEHGLTGSLRQLGDQEVDIVSMVENITKYAFCIRDPESVRYHLERAMHLAVQGRPGPCWLDFPVDVQGALIDPDKLCGYDPEEDAPKDRAADLPGICDGIVRRLQAAERPVLMGGTGVRLAGAVPVFRRLARKLGIPVTTAWTHDLIADDDPCFCGRPGTIGDRAGNFTVQNSDVLLVVGSRLNIRQVSYNWKSFARHAWKIQVDVDAAELAKPLVRPDQPVCADARLFLEEMDKALDRAGYDSARHVSWRGWCRERRSLYPCYIPDRHVSKAGAINPYHFLHTLSRNLGGDDIVVCGNATACIVTFQTAHIREGQILFSNSGSASMGYDLPAAIGAAVAGGGRRVVCLAGDGSLQMNIQELQTWALHRWPIKLFVLNNGGYLSIRQTQANFFGRTIGSDRVSGLGCPDFVKLAEAYGLPSVRLAGPDFEEALQEVLSRKVAEVCEVMLDPSQGFEPKLSSRKLEDGRMVSSPLEDMAPFLGRDEFKSNMKIPMDGE